MEQLEIKRVIMVGEPRVAAALSTYALEHGLKNKGYPIKDRFGNLSFVFDDTPEMQEIIELFQAEELRINAKVHFDTLNEIEGILAADPFGGVPTVAKE